MYKLQIQNYQIIHKANIDFNKGLTLITGRSNNGKSSIFKAFKQLAYNTPGTDYIKHGHTQCTIQLNTPDGHYISYTKPTSGGAVYHLDNQPPLQKVGSTQPESIKDTLHIDKDLNYNFWNQLDKPFLISNSPKEQFDLLQQSPHTEVLQSTMQQMSTDRKAIQQKFTQTQAQIQLLQEQNKSQEVKLLNLPKFTHLFNSINDIKSTKESLSNLVNTLNRYKQIDPDSIQKELLKFSNLPNLDSLKLQFEDVQFFQLKLQNLIQTQNPINEFQNQIQQTTLQIDRIKLFIQQYFPLCPLCNRPFDSHNS